MSAYSAFNDSGEEWFARAAVEWKYMKLPSFVLLFVALLGLAACGAKSVPAYQMNDDCEDGTYTYNCPLLGLGGAE